MRAIVPLASRDPEFQRAGYDRPRPLIKVGGRRMVEWATDCLDGFVDEESYVFPVLQEHVSEHDLDESLREIYDPNIHVVVLDEMVEGPAQTVLEAEEYIDDDELIILFGDQYLAGPFEEQIAETDADGLIPVFESTEQRWGYAETDDSNRVTEVAEKDVISSSAIPGFHYFKRGTDYVTGAERMIEKDIRTHDIFKVSPVYNELIEMGRDIRATPVDDMVPLGTPEDVERFEQRDHTGLN